MSPDLGVALVPDPDPDPDPESDFNPDPDPDPDPDPESDFDPDPDFDSDDFAVAFEASDELSPEDDEPASEGDFESPLPPPSPPSEEAAASPSPLEGVPDLPSDRLSVL